MNVSSLRRTALVLALVPFAAACMGGPPGAGRGPGGGPNGGPGGGPGGGPVASLFISPFGEPFQGEPGGPWPVAEWFAGADRDGDGVVDFAEFEADGLRWFAHLDRNANGRLDPSELADYETGLNGLRGAGRGGFPRDGDGAAPRGDGPPRARLAGGAAQSHLPSGEGRGRRGPQSYGLIAEAGFFNLPQPVRAADTDLNQTVTAAEWAAATQRWFVALDTDHDGRLTLATLPQTSLQQRAANRPQGRRPG